MTGFLNRPWSSDQGIIISYNIIKDQGVEINEYTIVLLAHRTHIHTLPFIPAEVKSANSTNTQHKQSPLCHDNKPSHLVYSARQEAIHRS